MSNPPVSLEKAAPLLRTGQFADAAALCEEILRTTPQSPEAFLYLGLARRGLNRTEDAIDAFQRAIALAPHLAEAHHQAGNALKKLGRFPEAIAALREATRIAPQQAAIWLNLGVACLEAELRDEAIASFQHALALEPNRPEAHNILGVALLADGQLSSARASLERAVALRPGYTAAHDNLGRLCKAEGRIADAIPHYRAALAVKPDPATHSNLLLALNYVPDLPPAEIFAEHRRWNELHAANLRGHPGRRPQAGSPTGPKTRRLRIGYVSPDFVHHAVSYFIEPVLTAHDRSRFEIFCYSNAPTPDRVTERLRQLVEPDHWRDIARLSDDDAAALIRGDTIDLLVDLAGHTARNRLLVFARRPAPVQATWIGYPNTTGLDAIDFRLTDAISDPVGETDSFYAEKLIRLPTAFSIYQPDDDAPAVTPLPAAARGAITFGSFNNFAKMSPPVVALWARLLRALPDSRLILKSRGLADPEIAARIRADFASIGVAPARIELDGRELSVAEHLSLYREIDIALDPFPYNGTTTTCEALWMGVPVLTLAGRTHVSRVGASLLTHAGLTDWIATTPDDFVARAVAATHDLPRLAELRRTLREQLRASPACDAPRFTRHLEDAFASLLL
jgi:predicted O-linked N-acetylglucosamine transferase (SPINDLY family)